MNPLITVSSNLEFCLSNERITYAFRVSPEGLLEHIHYGEYLSDEDLTSLLEFPNTSRRIFRCAAPNFEGIEDLNLSDIPQELPLFGTSDMRYPALHIKNAHGNTTNVLRYQTHRIQRRKPILKQLPSAREAVNDGSETLVIVLYDLTSAIEVSLLYTVYRDHDVIARSMEVKNLSEEELSIQHAMSASIDFPVANYDLVHLRGTWSREFNIIRSEQPAGRFLIEAASGTSSSHHNPFLALVDANSTETAGNVFGFALMYSGNFAISSEMGEFDALRVMLGINPFNFCWHLEPGEAFHTPEALMCFSTEGLQGMSLEWHRFITRQVSPETFSKQPRPSYLNSWEAAYFDISHQKVLELADQAVSLGVEMLVVDDGWFGKRKDATSSLGDWHSDLEKFPDGIIETAKAVNSKGLKFGLWFEPEMVNPDSDLFRDHPDWVIQVPGRELSTGRHQLTLNLGMEEVRAYLIRKMDPILGSGCIHYVKWDMNRVMTEIGSGELDESRQQEVAHRYMLGLYSLVSNLTEKYPDILFENCASGGNRFDLGMLRYMSQGWVSDMSEPIGRLAIISGASLLFPPSVLASYVGPVPSHQNGRLVSLKTRAGVGFFCAARGLSLNHQDLEDDRDAIRSWINLYKRTASDLVSGEFLRLKNDANEVCWQLNSESGEAVYVGYFHILSAPNLPFQRVKLRRLDAEGEYIVEQLDADGRVNETRPERKISGSALMNYGLDLPYVHSLQPSAGADYMENGDFSTALFIVRKQL